MQLLWTEVKKYKKLLILALSLATINQAASMVTPLITQKLIDDYASKIGSITQHDYLHGVLGLILLSMLLTLFSRIAKAFQDYYVNVINQRAGTNLYAQSVNHAFSLPYSVFEDERSGQLLNKLQKARTDSQLLISNLINIVFLSLIGIIFAIGYAFFVQWMIGVIFILLIPVMGSVMFFLSRKIKEVQAPIVKATAELSGSTTETLRNVELVKSLGLEKQEVDRLNNVNEKILSLELNKVKLVRKIDFIQGTLINTIYSALIFILFWFIFQGTITIGQYLTLWVYTFFIFEPLRGMSAVATSYQEAKASLGQLEDVFAIKPVPIPVDAVVIDKIETISYDHVSLQYKGAERPAINDVSLEMRWGEAIAFVGPSGSGKSTMIKLILGLYEPTGGGISFNNANLKQVHLEELRKKIGLVAQETQLFAGTIRENLLFVKPDATDEECTRALDLAQAKTILERTDQGLSTRIGEGGLKLSGGEKQRLAIARALLRDPDLIIFDEATSSLDSLTEAAITETIKDVRQTKEGLIQIMVAHRLSTILHADRIYVFEKGKIIETGTHEELVSQNGLYAALWREQVAEK